MIQNNKNHNVNKYGDRMWQQNRCKKNHIVQQPKSIVNVANKKYFPSHVIISNTNVLEIQGNEISS